MMGAAKLLPWRYIGLALAVAGALWWAYGAVHERGVMQERATWQAARAELLRLRTERANTAATRLAEVTAAAPPVATKEIIRVETHWRDRPVRECFDADLVQSLEEARAAVRRSAAPGTSSD